VGQYRLKHLGQYLLKRVGQFTLKWVGQYGVILSAFKKIEPSTYGNFEQIKLDNTYTVPSDGTVYIYFANESNDAGSQVYADDFTVIHEKTTRSLNVTQVNDYYPFGGVMEGTAYNDASRQAQLYKFNGNEVLEGEGIPTTLNLMNFNARLYNPASLSRSFSEAKHWVCFWRWTRRGSLPAPIWRLGIIRLTLLTRTGNWLGLCL